MGDTGMFYYKQAPRIKGPYRYGGSQEFSAVSYAYQYTGDPLFGQVAAICYAHNGPDIRSLAWLPYSLHHVIPLFSPLRAQTSVAGVVMAPDTPGMADVTLRNVSEQDVAATVTVGQLWPGVRAETPPNPVRVPAGAEVRVPVKLTAEVQAVGTSGSVAVVVTYSERTQALPVRAQVLATVVSIDLRAADGTAAAPMVTGPHAEVPRDAAFTGSPWPPEADHGTLTWDVEIPVAGSYVLLGDCWWMDNKGDSFYVRIDDQPAQVLGNDPRMGAWHWTPPTNAFTLSAGRHRIVLSGREEGGRLRTLRVTNAPVK